MLSKFLSASKFCFKDSRFSFVPKNIYNSFTLNSTSVNPQSQSDENLKTDEESKGRFKNWTGRNSYKLGLIILGVSGLSFVGFSLVTYGSPVHTDGIYEEDEYSSMNPVIAYPLRTIKHYREFNKNIKDPIREKLLPDPHPLYQPLTLVIEVNDILLHPEWSYRSGWKFKKRPGLELFLEAVSPFFEVVVFTNDSAMNLHPILHQIDPNCQSLHYRLYRESTRYSKGVHIKDLSNLNRDPKKMIRVDWSKEACSLQPENTLLIKRWAGDNSDRELVDLAAFLRMIATNNLNDVRDGLEHYSKFDDPLMEFRRRCEELQDHMKNSVTNTKSKKSNLAIGNVLRHVKRN